MEVLKETIWIANRTIGMFGLGFGCSYLFRGTNYKIASWTLFIVAILFIVGYFVERYS